MTHFLGGRFRTAPWWALALSIVATETSTLTIIGTPALAFAGDLTFLQLVLGYLVGRVVIVLLFLPHYFRGEYYTAYQIMERRFGAKVKAAAASTFLITRALAEGVRIAAIALVVKAALGTGERTSVLVIMALVLIYTFEGGMKAVIWTDVAQFSFSISAARSLRDFLRCSTKFREAGKASYTQRPRRINFAFSIFHSAW